MAWLDGERRGQRGGEVRLAAVGRAGDEDARRDRRRFWGRGGRRGFLDRRRRRQDLARGGRGRLRWRHPFWHALGALDLAHQAFALALGVEGLVSGASGTFAAAAAALRAACSACQRAECSRLIAWFFSTCFRTSRFFFEGR